MYKLNLLKKKKPDVDKYDKHLISIFIFLFYDLN